MVNTRLPNSLYWNNNVSVVVLVVGHDWICLECWVLNVLVTGVCSQSQAWINMRRIVSARASILKPCQSERAKITGVS